MILPNPFSTIPIESHNPRSSRGDLLRIFSCIKAINKDHVLPVKFVTAVPPGGEYSVRGKIYRDESAEAHLESVWKS
jgi:hypothetical protein